MRSLRRLIALGAFLVPGPSMADTSGVIAYVSPSRDNARIRVVGADGSGERTLFAVPDGTHRSIGIGTLAWSPNGERLAFSSSHDWKRSIRSVDIYVVPREGGDVVRATTPPDRSAYDEYPKGRVKVRVENPTHTTADIVLWVEGASEPKEDLVRRERWTEYVFEDVADFGEGIRQYVRVFNKTEGTFWGCWMETGAFADVMPGENVDAGTLSYQNEANCISVWAPDWIDDDTFAALAIEWPRNVNPPNNIWAFKADPDPGDQPVRLLDMGGRSNSDKVFAVSIGPEIDGKRQAILLRHGALATAALLTEVDDMEQISPISIGDCPDTSCGVLDIAWRPDGEAVYVSEYQDRSGSVIFEFADATLERREIVRLPGEVIGRITLSPDGNTIAFERAKRMVDHYSTLRYGDQVLCPCSIWMVDVDGGNLREFIADGRAPAWTE